MRVIHSIVIISPMPLPPARPMVRRRPGQLTRALAVDIPPPRILLALAPAPGPALGGGRHLARVAQRLVAEQLLIHGRVSGTLPERVVLVADIREVVDLLGRQKHVHGQRVDGGVAPPLRVEPALAVQVAEVVLVGVAAEEVEVGDLKVAPVVAHVPLVARVVVL